MASGFEHANTVVRVKQPESKHALSHNHTMTVGFIHTVARVKYLKPRAGFFGGEDRTAAVGLSGLALRPQKSNGRRGILVLVWVKPTIARRVLDFLGSP